MNGRKGEDALKMDVMELLLKVEGEKRQKGEMNNGRRMRI